jgi:hypothetical protein
VLPAIAQEPVKRPAVPSTSTLNSPTSQIAAWYKYAVYCESVIATRDAQLQAAQIDSAKIAAILDAITAIDAKISAPQLPTPQPPPSDGTTPVFTLGPSSQEIPSGTSATFTVAASGNPAPTFQWYVNGTLIPGATGASLTRGPYVFPDGANSRYIVVASNSVGSAVAGPAALWVLQSTEPLPPPVTPPTPPVVTPSNPDDAFAGSTVTFEATAEGSPAPTFTWKKNGVTIDGATSATLQLVAVTSADSGEYVAVASNTEGAAESLPAKLNVIPAP